MGLLNPGGPIAQFKRNRCSISPVELILQSGVRIRVLPSSTLEFDGQFNGGGETIFTEINLNEDHTIDDMFCTCGAGSLCVHLAAMMYDMVERDTIQLSEQENESENR